MDEEDIERLVNRELAAFKKKQAAVDAEQKKRLQALAGMKQNTATITAAACQNKGLMSMSDFLQLMNRIKSAEKGQLYQKKEELILDEDEELIDLSGVLDDESVEDEGAPPPGRGSPPCRRKLSL